VSGVGTSERVVRDIRRRTRRRRSGSCWKACAGRRGIAALCRREGIAESLYYAWSKEFLEAGKRRLAGDTRAAPRRPTRSRRYGRKPAP
jgi:transposase